ncbi:MAG: oligosaccharide flippase family protein [Crocinitomicaceae bacterium]|nr:oligosaccharide flippase family protein [Crocinitomicaceae bacterium]
MLRDLIKEGGLYSLANLLTKGISLLLIPFYTRYFSPEDYGVIDMFTVFGFFITGILTLQLSQGLARYVAEPTLKRYEKIEFASSAIWSALFFLTISFVGLALLADPIINLLFEGVEVGHDLYFLALLTIYLNALFYFLGVYLRFIRRTKTFSFLSFIHALCTILLTWLFVAYFKYEIKSVYYAYIIVVPFLIVTQYILLKHKIKLIIVKKRLTELLRYSLPFIPVSIAVILMSFTDRLFIKHYLDFNELGVYGIGFKFNAVIAVFVSGFGMAITPIILERHNKDGTKTELKNIFNLFISISSVAVLSLSFFARETLQIFTTEEYMSAYAIMPYVYLTAVYIGLNMFTAGLLINKRSGLMAIITLVFASINVGLNFLLVPKFQLEGAAISTMAATIGQQITLFYFSQNNYKIPINYFKVLTVVVITFVLAIGSIYVTWEKYWIELAIKIAVITVFVLLIFKLGIFDFKRFQRFLQSRARNSDQ